MKKYTRRFNVFFFSAPFVLLIWSCSPDGKKTALPLYTSSDFTDSVFTAGIEGPAVDKEGNVYVVNFQRPGTIGKVNPSGVSSLFIELKGGSIGNGIRFSRQMDMYIADYVNHNILKVSMDDPQIEVFAHDSTMNQPNDLAIMDNDILFASDPNWKASTGNLWRIDTKGVMTLLEADMGTTNGVEVSPDNKTLYVNESVQRNIWSYKLNPQGDISDKKLFFQFDDYGMDGMRCDAKGNLYVTRHGKGTVAIISPEGKLIIEVVLKGKKPSNIAFGGVDGNTCYVTLQDRGRIEKFDSEYPGRSWQMLKP